MKGWLRQHAYALKQALRNAFKPRSGFLLNVLVVSIALALPFAGLTLIENIRPVSEQLAVDPEISIFLATDLPREKATALDAQIRHALQDAKSGGSVEFIAREKALASLKGKTGLADALATLGENPLPDAYVLRLRGVRGTADPAKIKLLAEKLKSLPGVEQVQLDSAWVMRLAALMQMLRLALLLLAATLGLAVIAVVFNTIRLQVMNQREEIEVSILVGATNAFIYRPFYYSGVLLALCAAGVALGAVTAGLLPLNDAIADLVRLYGSDFRLAPLSLETSLLLLLLSATLGLIGARLSVMRHLARLTHLR